MKGSFSRRRTATTACRSDSSSRPTAASPSTTPLPTINTFVLRKARPTFSGRVAKYFDFKITAELAGSATILDAYFDIRFSPKLRLRSGKDKTPVGYELLISDAALVFPERSLVSLLVPNRDVGFQAQGDLAGGKLVYAGGIFNGNPVDGSSSTTDVDVNSGKDLAGRVVFYPFRSTSEPQRALSNFGFHVGGSTGDQSGTLPTFRTTAGQTYFAFPATVTADGTRTRVSPAVFLYAKSFGGFAEYARTTQDVLSSGTPLTVTNQAWGVTATYVLTGESTSERGVKPRRPFDPAAGTCGRSKSPQVRTAHARRPALRERHRRRHVEPQDAANDLRH